MIYYGYLLATLAILLSYHAHLYVVCIAAYIIGGHLGGSFISAFYCIGLCVSIIS